MGSGGQNVNLGFIPEDVIHSPPPPLFKKRNRLHYFVPETHQRDLSSQRAPGLPAVLPLPLLSGILNMYQRSVDLTQLLVLARQALH